MSLLQNSWITDKYRSESAYGHIKAGIEVFLQEPQMNVLIMIVAIGFP